VKFDIIYRTSVIRVVEMSAFFGEKKLFKTLSVLPRWFIFLQRYWRWTAVDWLALTSRFAESTQVHYTNLLLSSVNLSERR